ncbi:hypothetical protein [Nonomuraea sp. B5E05]|uniref:hypothetical protein n=1 Tax=Nonomuraea sp. B5E05 TaxID=3153569 RepID=UPI00326156C6
MIRIEPETLLTAGKLCHEAALALAGEARTFESGAAPTDGCFGLVERGADELAESYKSFHEELHAFTFDLAAKLEDSATGLRETARTMGGL